MYTKEEMLMFTTCVGLVRCEDCPFEKNGGELVYKPSCYEQNISQYKKEKEMEENKPSHPFKVGVKYFLRDKNSWRRFVGYNMDRNGPYLSGIFTDPNGYNCTYEIDNPKTSITGEEWKEPTPEPKFEKKTFYKPSIYFSGKGEIDDDCSWKLNKSDFKLDDGDLDKGDHIIWVEKIFEIPMEEK